MLPFILPEVTDSKVDLVCYGKELVLRKELYSTFKDIALRMDLG